MTAGYAPTARAVFVPPPPDVIEDELAYRIGVRGARRPEQPSTDVTAGPEALAPILPTVETESWPERRSRRRRAAVGLTGVAAALAAAFVFAVLVLPGLGVQGGVLSETFRPEVSDGAGLVPASAQPDAACHGHAVVCAAAGLAVAVRGAVVARAEPLAGPVRGRERVREDRVRDASAARRGPARGDAEANAQADPDAQADSDAQADPDAAPSTGRPFRLHDSRADAHLRRQRFPVR